MTVPTNNSCYQGIKFNVSGNLIADQQRELIDRGFRRDKMNRQREGRAQRLKTSRCRQGAHRPHRQDKKP